MKMGSRPKELMQTSQLFRLVDCAIDAHCVGDIFKMTPYQQAVVIAAVESRRLLERARAWLDTQENE